MKKLTKKEFFEILDYNFYPSLYSSIKNTFSEDYIENIFNENIDDIIKYSVDQLYEIIFPITILSEDDARKKIKEDKEEFKSQYFMIRYYIDKMTDEEFQKVIQNANDSIPVMKIKNYRDRNGAGKKISFVDFEEYFMIRKFLPSKIEYLVFENYCRIEGKMFGYLFYEDEYYHIKR